MKNTTFVLVALVATIGIAFGTPMQLSGEAGKNISMNLTDDSTFMVVEGINGTSTVIVIGGGQLTQYALDMNMNTTMNPLKYA
jgi:hypothetical protein